MRVADTEALGGLVLTLAVAAALLWANLSPGSYASVWAKPTGFHLLADTKSVVNNGLMTLFFFAVGLEVGRERSYGSLSENRTAVLPVAAALGGMAGAALTYAVVAAAGGAGAEVARGWGVPMATDVAFTLGALALLGRRVPPSLRAFVLALAVADDVASVAVLAVVSRNHVRILFLLGALGVLAFGWFVRRRFRRPWWPWVLLLALTWWLLAEGGVEATLAGAFVGMLVPCAFLATNTAESGPPERSAGETTPSTLLESVTHPVSTFVVLPLFMLANAGVVLGTHLFTVPSSCSVIASVVAARTLGKVIGITLAAAAVVKLGVARLPTEITWAHLAGAAVLCGMGITVPLLFATATFSGHPHLVWAAQTGLLIGTALTFVLGFAVLWWAARRGP